MLIYRSHVVVVPSLCYFLVVSLKTYMKSTINLFVKKTKLIETVVRRTIPTEKKLKLQEMGISISFQRS